MSWLKKDPVEQLANLKAQQGELTAIIRLQGAMSIMDKQNLVKYAGDIAALEAKIAKGKS